MEMDFNQKTALVTGAAAGIGAATAQLLCERGLKAIVLVDINREGLQNLEQQIKHEYPNCFVQICALDISQRAAIRDEIKPALDRIGVLDILVNSAGVADENAPHESDIWHKVLDINLNGTYYVTIEALEKMPKASRIINVSSILGRAGNVRNTAYCTSKHALLGFTKSLAMDLASQKITVNAVLPGWVDTPMLRKEIAINAEKIGADPDNMLRTARKKMPMKRFTQAEDVAETIAFLASSAAGNITAQSFTVDGGFTCGV